MTTLNKIVVIDDELPIRKILALVLESSDYKVFEAEDGKNGLIQIATQNPQLVILDLGLPDRDGFSVLKELRTWSNIPVLILSVKNSEEDIVRALDLGADDYIKKPFNTQELMARIRANIRRTQQIDESSIIPNGELEIDLTKRIVRLKQQELKLTATEYHLLALFMRNIGKVLTHSFILKEIWGPGSTENTQYLRVFTAQLRRKIEDDLSQPKYIITESGVGYRMRLVK